MMILCYDVITTHQCVYVLCAVCVCLRPVGITPVVAQFALVCVCRSQQPQAPGFVTQAQRKTMFDRGNRLLCTPFYTIISTRFAQHHHSLLHNHRHPRQNTLCFRCHTQYLQQFIAPVHQVLVSHRQCLAHSSLAVVWYVTAL